MSDTFCHVKNRPCYRDDCEPGKFCAMYDKPVTNIAADPTAAEARERTMKIGNREVKVREDSTPFCAFCGKARAEVKRIINGPTVGICNDCIELLASMIGIERSPQGPARPAEASAWRPMREARDAMLDAIRVLDRDRACVIDNNAEDRDEEGDPIASSITDADALHEIAEYTSIIERLKSALPPPPEGGE